jgi:hypothetical protein
MVSTLPFGTALESVGVGTAAMETAAKPETWSGSAVRKFFHQCFSDLNLSLKTVLRAARLYFGPLENFSMRLPGKIPGRDSGPKIPGTCDLTSPAIGVTDETPGR